MKKKTSKKSMTLKKKILLIVCSVFLVAIISFFTGYGIYAYQLNKSVPAELTEEVTKQNQTTTNEFKSTVWIARDERKVNAKSLLGVLSLGITKGVSITISAEGVDEEEAVEGLVSLVNSNFVETI